MFASLKRLFNLQSLFNCKWFVPVSRGGVVLQAREICEDYIHDKLDNSGLLKKQLRLGGNNKSKVSLEVIAMGTELETRHPKVYREISRKLNMTMRDQITVDKTLTEILENLFDDDETTWAKVISMFALAGQFALECVQQGHPEFVKVVVDSVVLFFSRHLADWVLVQGGWKVVVGTLTKKRGSCTPELFAMVIALATLLATTIATISTNFRVSIFLEQTAERLGL